MKSLQELRSLFKAPLLLHRWLIEIPTWPAACQPENPDITFLVQTSDVPNVSETEVQVQLGSFTMNFNGKQERNSEISWTFPDNIDLIVAKYFIEYERQRQNWNDSANILVSAAYDEDLVIPVVKMRLLDPSNTKFLGTYELYNCYLRTSNFTGSLDQDATASQITATVVYDGFIFKAEV